MRIVAPLIALIILAMPFSAMSAQPIDSLKGPIDEVIGLLKDPRYKDEAKASVQKDKIWKIIRDVFDFTEMAKRALARNWMSFSPQQRQEFSELFAEFLGNNYLEKIQSGFQDEKVVFVDQMMITESKAVVKTKILRESIEIPVDYSMFNRGGPWRVYDVNIEGVSLVKNYRSQFNKTLMNKKPSDLIEILKKKIARQKEKKSAPDSAGSMLDGKRLVAHLCYVLSVHREQSRLALR